jgi:hypothetical protein
MSFDPLTAGFNFVTKTIDKIFPDAGDREKAKIKLAQLQQAGDLKELEIGMSAIVAEAKSADPWTSRARPSFLYVMYLIILFSIPIGILSVFRPDAGIQIANGMKAYLGALPTELWWTFGTGYGGYTVARSAWDKRKGQ